MKEESVSLKVTGMTCDHCATHIEKMFENKEGIISKKVSYKSGEGNFSYNPDVISKDTIINTINESKSYKAKEKS